MPTSLRYVFRRLVQALPMAFAIVLLNFLLLKLTPGDLADVIAGESGSATPEFMENLRRLYGLDIPVHLQFLNYIQGILHFDLGYSFRQGMPVGELILERLPATILLSLTAILFALLVGVLLGVVAARSRGSLLDEAISVVSTMGFATPLFWVGLMLIVLFSIELRWLPSAGMVTVGADYRGRWDEWLDIGRHLVLPAVTLSLFFLSIYVRITRSAMLEVYGLDFVRTARAKGLTEARVVIRHVLRNALLPIVTVTGLQLGAIFGGTVVVETVFGWPGLGRLAQEAVFSRDVNLLLGIFLCSSFIVIVVNLAVDLLYAALDPRVEVRQ
ncbi:ABC transporter permease subunit [Azospirillum melinis]|uniref:ABC transporter permease subunit n=1 Tax=Azospirillum melinis TaxID=328839 RepID=A0ABX2K9H5_9PROT|nr:ABC transporter permease [Azospirillum melinis]MBP2305900.1 peptide/nickel transport system permease protein [Azospirillum melinis]NUA99190.1 ABC transporter permease subunit [Azospirillum melinis]